MGGRPGPGRAGATIGTLLACLAFVATGFWMAGLFGPAPGSSRLRGPLVEVAGWVIAAFFGACFATLVAARIRPGLFDRRLRSREELDRH